jgi:serine/threonine protein phosphatase PrpC
MDVPISCPTCRMQLRVPGDLRGRPVRCPGCKAVFAARPEPIRLHVSRATSPGRVRDRNEDGLLVAQLAWAAGGADHEIALMAVLDGMGGHAAGDRAAAVAAHGLASALLPRLAGLVAGVEPLPDDAGFLEMLDLALWEANRAVHRVAAEDQALTGMGATAVAALVCDGTAAICHVGDCRAYLWRGGTVRVLTRDQTLAARMVELGTLTERQAKGHPAASQVTQALGRQYDIEPSRQTLALAADDMLVLACDGLHAHLDEAAVAAVLGRHTTASALVEAANAAGGSDNCTVVVGRAIV